MFNDGLAAALPVNQGPRLAGDAGGGEWSAEDTFKAESSDLGLRTSRT